MNKKIMKIMLVCCTFALLIIGCDKALTPIDETSPATNDISSSTNNSSSSIRSNSSTDIQSSVTSTDDQSSSTPPPSNSSGGQSSSDTQSFNDSNSSNDSQSVDDTQSNADNASSATPASSSSATSDDSSNSVVYKDCDTYTERICLQELKPYYDKNEILENYNGTFHYYEPNFDYYKHNCQVCGDTVRFSKAILKYAIDNGNNDDKSLYSIEASDVTDELPLTQIMEGVDRIGQISFDFWNDAPAKSKNLDSIQKSQILKNATEGENPRLRLVNIIFTNDDDSYTMSYTTLNTDTLEGKLHWKFLSSSCDLDECFE
ncbi:MAG: hypothetical protein OCD01_06280 [Fibrobacterales bacterium]